jgi:hypothetical protein
VRKHERRRGEEEVESCTCLQQLQLFRKPSWPLL